jgi:predicted dehydrogenase
MKSVQWTRRRFIKGAAAALGVPTIIPSSVFGNSQAAPPSERVTLGHIGVGGRGTALLQQFADLADAQCIAICDTFRDRREKRASQVDEHYAKTRGAKSGKGCATYNDFRVMLARKDLDGVVIATPDHWHVPIAIAAIRAGKDVYVEKPLGLCIEQDRALREVVRSHRAVFQYGTQQRSEQDFRVACELVQNGRIGDLKSIDVWCPEGGEGGSMIPEPIPAGFDFPRWLGPAPVAPYTTDRCMARGGYWIYDYSIGFIAGWGVHPMDVAQWGAVVDSTCPSEYEGTGSLPREGLYNTVTSWDMRCRYASGLEIHFMSQDLAQPVVEKYREHHNHGTTFFGSEGWVSVGRNGIWSNPATILESEIGPDDKHLCQSDDHRQNFVDCIRSRKDTVSPIDSAVRVDAISQLCNIAIRLGRPVKWDPDNEKVLNDPEAEKMLSRPIRSPWTL